MSHETLNQRVRSIVDRAVEVGFDTADQAVLASLLQSAGSNEITPLLKEFFDFEPVVLELFEQFIHREADWDTEARTQLIEALLFHGFDTEAYRVQRSVV